MLFSANALDKQISTLQKMSQSVGQAIIAIVGLRLVKGAS